MNPKALKLACNLVLVYFACTFPLPAHAKITKAKTLKRTYDAVSVDGSALRQMAGKPLEKLRLYSFLDGKFVPVPFQIDEKDAQNNYVLEQGSDKGKDDAPGVLDANDELVFMAWDAGDQISLKEFPQGVLEHSEIEVRDPETKEEAYVYLLLFDAPPSLSDADYVKYKTETEEVDAFYYGVKFSEDAPLVFDSMYLKKQIGGDEKNTIDRLKIRFTGKLILGLRVSKNEEDFKTELLAYKDGPVRVIRRTKSEVVFYGIFKSPSAVGNELFYGNYFYFPFVVDFPFDVKDVFAEAKMRLTTEMSPGTTMVYFNSNISKGLTVDGVMSDEEKNVNRAPFTWAVVQSSAQGNTTAFLNMPVISASVPIQPNLFYMDDEALEDAPENFPGQRGNLGYELDNFQWLKKGAHSIGSVLFALPDFKAGDEAQFFNLINKPLKIWIGKAVTLDE